MYGKILVPTDGSAAAEDAATHAIDIGRRYGATLHALSVVDAGELGFASPSTADLDEVRSSVRADAERAAGRVAALADDAGVDAVEAVRIGVPHDEILSYAAEEEIGLIVMGTRGRTGLDRVLLGSVTERVVRTADVPVLAVTPAAEDGGDGADHL